MKHHIYLMRCPFTGDPVYVGKTTRFKERVTMHLTSAKSPLLWFIERCRDSGFEPTFEVLISIENANTASLVEKGIISYYSKTFYLLNVHHNDRLKLNFKEYGEFDFKS